MKGGENYYFYHNDHLGTPQKITAINGTVVWSAKYESFGKAEVDPDSTAINNLRFPGQYFDAETGLHCNYHRYYDPRTGRYLRADPIGTKGGINLYVYGVNNPLIYTDPKGLIPIPFPIPVPIPPPTIPTVKPPEPPPIKPPPFDPSPWERYQMCRTMCKGICGFIKRQLCFKMCFSL